MDRRKFISSSLAVGGALAGAGLYGKEGSAWPATRPNILFITVDEMRYPTVFPSGVNSAAEFLEKFMPNTFRLWKNGVKFSNYHTASAACSPSRGSFVTGLYSQQHWVTQTLRNAVGSGQIPQPVLSPVFPTYGRLLRQAGYRTPYIGKWHISNVKPATGLLSAYGFDDMTYPDPVGSNLQGSVGLEPNFHSDQYIARQAAAWLSRRAPGEQPWCLTVCFVDPHDKAYFWAGTEYLPYARLFQAPPAPQPLLDWSKLDLGKDIPYEQNPLRNPPAFGYPEIPPNWESASRIAANKPSTQTFGRLFQQLFAGGVADNPENNAFTTAPYPKPRGKYALGVAPQSYWRRNLDSYTQVMSRVDGHIGTVLQALPHAVAQNTIIVFTSDHGEFAGAHGFVSGKSGACYEEVLKVPLIVADPSGRFAGDADVVRDQLTSSIDLTPMLVSLAYNGSQEWIQGNLLKLYGRRHNMIPLLRSAAASGRPYAAFATDELIQAEFNFNNAPSHIVALLTENAKLALYSNWLPGTTTIDKRSIEIEFYDYRTPGGRAELDNVRDHPQATKMLDILLNEVIPKELRAPLPAQFGRAQDEARRRYLAYAALVDTLGVQDLGLIVGL